MLTMQRCRLIQTTAFQHDGVLWCDRSCDRELYFLLWTQVPTVMNISFDEHNISISGGDIQEGKLFCEWVENEMCIYGTGLDIGRKN